MRRSPLNIFYLKEEIALLFSEELKKTLLDLIDELAQQKEKFVLRPGKDFTRNRKQSFQRIIQFIISMENDSIKRELMKYFNFLSDAPTDAAFNLQRGKIKPSAFEFLFHKFTNRIPDEKNYKGYKLVACDGSSLCIYRNPEDSATYVHQDSTTRGFNLLHLNTLYDLCNRKFLDAFIQPAHQKDERNALLKMIKKSEFPSPNKTIIIADRGYTSLKLFAYLDKSSLKYLIRFKEAPNKNIAYGIELPDLEYYDFTTKIFLTHQRKKDTLFQKNKTVKYLRRASDLDEFDVIGTNDDIPLTLRFVRFPLTNDSYEILVTNLSEDEFDINELRELYGMRWGIENSYKELKYAAGLNGFHSKKREYIEQEIWSKLILYNYGEAVAMRINVERKPNDSKTKYIYELNYTTALYLCRLFLKEYTHINAISLETTIEKNILPVRKGRLASRMKRPAKPASFCYRTS